MKEDCIIYREKSRSPSPDEQAFSAKILAYLQANPALEFFEKIENKHLLKGINLLKDFIDMNMEFKFQLDLNVRFANKLVFAVA